MFVVCFAVLFAVMCDACLLFSLVPLIAAGLFHWLISLFVFVVLGVVVWVLMFLVSLGCVVLFGLLFGFVV